MPKSRDYSGYDLYRDTNPHNREDNYNSEFKALRHGFLMDETLNPALSIFTLQHFGPSG